MAGTRVVGGWSRGEGARIMHIKGLASVRARAWRASTCSDIDVPVDSF